jgi:hypothetical protein
MAEATQTPQFLTSGSQNVKTASLILRRSEQLGVKNQGQNNGLVISEYHNFKNAVLY